MSERENNSKEAPKTAGAKATNTLLLSSKEADILTGMKSLNQRGDLSSLSILIELLAKPATSDRVKQEIIKVIHELKLPGAATIVIPALSDPKNRAIRQQLLSATWNARLDVSGYLHVIAAILIDCDYETGIECFTLLDNLDKLPDEGSLAEAQLILAEYLALKPNPETEPLVRASLDLLTAISRSS
jgi:hypothetical protein